MRHALATKATAAAIPYAVADTIEELDSNTPVPAGHAFELYCPIWANRHRFDGPEAEGKTTALAAVANCKADNPLNEAIYKRNRHLAGQSPDHLSLPLILDSALITGSGIEHPTENGFSFMRPYGVPFVAGSGIKGTLRAAAEYKALFEAKSQWRMIDVWWLFGWEPGADYWDKPAVSNPDLNRAAAFREAIATADAEEQQCMNAFFDALLDIGQTDAKTIVTDWCNNIASATPGHETLSYRGLLDFWDLPLLNASCAVDIMTPHYTEYYQGKASPHDGMSPVPISMLVVEPGAKATLTIQWTQRITQQQESIETIKSNWQSMLEELVLDVIKWNGFGAKTAVGYGRFIVDDTVATQDKEHKDQQQAQAAAAEKAATAEKLTEQMGPEKFAIFELQSEYNDQSLTAGDLVTKTKEVILAATGSWDAADRKALHKLASEIYKANKVKLKRKKQERQSLLENLIK